MLEVSSRVRIPDDEFRFSYARSSGPGGQNVNKVNSKATLRWRVTGSPSLPDDIRRRFLLRFGRRITREGEFVLTSQRFRDQSQNQRDCLEKLRSMLTSVAVPPKRRKATKPTRSSIERRHVQKRAHSVKKQTRRAPPDE